MTSKSRHFKGLAISPGIAIGIVHLLESEKLSFPRFWISDAAIPHEIKRFQQALKKTQKELAHIKDKLCKFQPLDQIGIIESHQMISRDALLIQGTIQKIRKEKINAEWAFDKSVQEIFDSFPKDVSDSPDSQNSYFKERYEELTHVSTRILKALMGSERPSQRSFPKNSIVVARDLSPTDTVQMVKGTVHGFVTEVGGPTSHTAIVARALEIPAIVGIDGISNMVRDKDPILLDGSAGLVILHPGKKDLTDYRLLQKKQERVDHLLMRETHLPSVTKDNYHLRLAANMELLEELRTIKQSKAEGIGLYRTEMLLLARNGEINEKEQFDVYKKILKHMFPHPVTIRTFDLGGDKVLEDGIESMNPALGLRAIRYCLKEKSLFRTQIRAILSASTYGASKILIPMVTNLDEIRQVKKIIADVREDLEKKKVFVPAYIPLGVMIEIPSAAIMADDLASEVDFLSIGTNDLIQYTLAVDRADEDVSYLYEPLHPAILRLLKIVCDAGKSCNIPVSLCGEMAGNPLYFMILMGLGLSELSMNPVSIPRVKKILRSVTFRQAKEILDRCLLLKTANEVEHLLKKEMGKVPGLDLLFS